MSSNKSLIGPEANMEYEMILRQIVRLIEGRMPERYALDGLANTNWWEKFSHNLGENVFEISGKVIKGLLKGLDILRQKIEELESRIQQLESQ